MVYRKEVSQRVSGRSVCIAGMQRQTSPAQVHTTQPPTRLNRQPGSQSHLSSPAGPVSRWAGADAAACCLAAPIKGCAAPDRVYRSQMVRRRGEGDYNTRKRLGTYAAPPAPQPLTAGVSAMKMKIAARAMCVHACTLLRLLSHTLRHAPNGRFYYVLNYILGDGTAHATWQNN